MKKFKIEYLLYLFIIIAPILDAGSFLYKQAFPNSTITIIRFENETGMIDVNGLLGS